MNAKLISGLSRRCINPLPALVWLSLLGGITPGIARAIDVFRTDASVPRTAAGAFANDAAHPCQFGQLEAPLHLVEAVNRALCENPQTRQAWANVKVQAAAVGVAKSAYLPNLTANLQDVRDHATTDVSGYPRLRSANRSTVYSGSIAANWILYDFGGRKAALDNAEALLAAARANQDAILQSGFSAVATDYYAAQAAAGKLALAKDTESIAHDSFTAASARVAHGVAAISDQLHAQTSYAQATLNRAKAEGELQTALGILASDMFLRPDQAITMPPAEDGVVPDQDFTASISTMIEEAQTVHPAIAAARAKLDAAIASEQQRRAEGLPNLSLIAKYSQNNQPASLGLGQPEFAATGRDWYVGMQLQIPLFEGLSRSYRVHGAQAQTEVQADTLDQVRQQVGLDVWKSYQALQTNMQNVGNSATLRQIAQRSFEVARGRYAAGVGSILELLDAQRALSEARQQRIQALTDWRAARLQLAAKIGLLDAGDIRTDDNPLR
ncbi:MAG: Type I secretion outer membrane protein, TolC family [uncultured Paraburkholderia sp.]|uniref:TolC family protein n=1 Tax=uncultured Paraburkholderia sp. TaxID=1822466 RepID=UPI00259A4896|nr:TolC family protein [uncultured Paraburkholderia sp.]CAH2895885.1 MAG: Type I secretion outer membrane protein, TolC family [uncultured Paraburkholderia sp.]CAH2919023.1 MAG: Type I secretion outer membrane protein, TolC family [uncultured Paraburkholderia sp.]